MSKPKQEKDVDIPKELLDKLLTESEIKMIKQRFLVMKSLSKGLSIRAVANRVRVGTDTVVRISKMLNASPDLKDFFKETSKTNSTSKWIFGEIKIKE